MKSMCKTFLVCGLALGLSACGGQKGFNDLDAFMADARARPGGNLEPIPEFRAYEAFKYSAANRRSPFQPPVEVVLVQEKKDPISDIKPDEDRPRELLEQFALSSLNMVGTLSRQDDITLWALISDEFGDIHRVREGQYMGKNHGRIVAINETTISIVEIVPDGQGGWLERPQTIQLSDSGA